jgi:nucleotide-binding universal stress UspA family protein
MKVLLAVDDSESSARAAQAARKLFGDDAEYTVVSVAPTVPLYWGDDLMSWGMAYSLSVPSAGYQGKMPLVMSRVETAAQTARDVAESADIDVAHAVGEEGDAARAIVEASHHYNADVIVVGTHDRGWFSRLLDPSTTEAVVRQSGVPVLVAP